VGQDLFFSRLNITMSVMMIKRGSNIYTERILFGCTLLWFFQCPLAINNRPRRQVGENREIKWLPTLDLRLILLSGAK